MKRFQTWLCDPGTDPACFLNIPPLPTETEDINSNDLLLLLSYRAKALEDQGYPPPIKITQTHPKRLQNAETEPKCPK